MIFRKAYDKHKRFPTACGTVSKTQQHFKRECDINHLMAKFQKTGLIDHLNTFNGDYADLTNVPDYQTALEKVQNAQIAFDSLPSSVRSKFENDPALFLDFVSNPDNQTELIDMGLAHPSAQPDPVQPPADPDPVDPAGGDLAPDA